MSLHPLTTDPYTPPCQHSRNAYPYPSLAPRVKSPISPPLRPLEADECWALRNAFPGLRRPVNVNERKDIEKFKDVPYTHSSSDFTCSARPCVATSCFTDSQKPSKRWIQKRQITRSSSTTCRGIRFSVDFSCTASFPKSLSVCM